MSGHHSGIGRAPLAITPAQEIGALLALVAFGLLVVLWLSLKLSGLAFAGGWPDFGLESFAKALMAMASDPTDPPAAFGRRLRGELAGPVGFWSVYAVVLAAALAGCLAARRVWRRGLSTLGVPARTAPTARWAGRAALGGLRVTGPERGRIVLGRFGRTLLAAEKHQSALVVAPPQSGKTTGVAIPALLEWDGPVICTSVKSDLLRDTHARRTELGEVAVFDPTEATGVPSSSWTPLGRCETWAGAQEMAGWLCSISRARSGSGLEDSEFWHKAAAKLLAPLLLAAVRSGGEIADVVRWVETQEREEVAAALDAAGEDDALRAAEANAAREERSRSSIYTTAETVLEAYGDPRVLAASRRAEITAARLLDGGSHTLYLCGPAHEQARLAPVFTALLEEIVAVADRAASISGRPIDPPLLIVGDELANIAPIRTLPTIASTGAGQGIQLLSIFQDLAQIKSRWGEEWRTITSNHRAKLFGAGLGDPETLDFVRRLSGEAEFSQRSRTAGRLGHHSQTDSLAYRPLAPASAVRESQTGTAILLYGNLPPARLRLRSWFSDPGLSALAAGPRRHPAEDPRSEDGPR